MILVPKRGSNYWEQGYGYIVFILIYEEKREGDFRESKWCEKEYDVEQAIEN